MNVQRAKDLVILRDWIGERKARAAVFLALYSLIMCIALNVQVKEMLTTTAWKFQDYLAIFLALMLLGASIGTLHCVLGLKVKGKKNSWRKFRHVTGIYIGISVLITCWLLQAMKQ